MVRSIAWPAVGGGKVVDNIYEENINKTLTVELTSKVKEKVPRKMAVQILGHNHTGEKIESNISWVIELEEKGSNPLRRNFRRVYNNPFDLKQILLDILEAGGVQELRNFLHQFDVPLDLILPPRSYRGLGGQESKGSIESSLPTHHPNFFSAGIKDAYAICLDRLYRKLKRHTGNPQINKLSNFVMILSSLYSLIDFINTETIYKYYDEGSEITPITWTLIRDYYAERVSACSPRPV